MLIERAKLSDIDTIEELLYEVHDVHASGRPDLFKKGLKKYTRDEIVSIMHDDNTPIYVYRENGTVVAYAFVVYMTPHNNSLVHIKTMYIDDLCVAKSLKHGGIGTKIMSDLEEIAKANNCYNILLNVYNFNTPAYNFYKNKCGMRELKTYMEKIIK